MSNRVLIDGGFLHDDGGGSPPSISRCAELSVRSPDTHTDRQTDADTRSALSERSAYALTAEVDPVKSFA